MSVAVKSRKEEVKNATQAAKRNALNAAGITISGVAKELSPVDKGFLRSSIAWAIDGGSPQYPPDLPEYAKDDKDGRKENAGVKAPRNTVIIGTNVVYAKYQHEGIVGRGSDPNRPLKYQMQTAEAKFLEKAAYRTEAKVKRDIQRALEGKLELEP